MDFNQNKLLHNLENNKYEFLDFGSSQGGSIDYIKKKFNYRNGIGIDINQK